MLSCKNLFCKDKVHFDHSISAFVSWTFKNQNSLSPNMLSTKLQTDSNTALEHHPNPWHIRGHSCCPQQTVLLLSLNIPEPLELTASSPYTITADVTGVFQHMEMSPFCFELIYLKIFFSVLLNIPKVLCTCGGRGYQKVNWGFLKLNSAIFYVPYVSM